MIFSDRKLVDRLPKKGDMHGSCKNPFSSCPRQSASGVIREDGEDEKPRLVLKIKLPPSQNKGEKPCKVSKDRADEKPVPLLPTLSGGTNNLVEEKPWLVFKTKLPPSLNKEKNDGKDERLVPTTSSSGNGMRIGYPFKKPIARCPTKFASRVATKKRFPASSTAEKKACHVKRAIKLPIPYTKAIELNGKSGGQSDPKALMPLKGGKKERHMIKMIKSSTLRQNKEEQLNTRGMVVEKMDEKALELKLEASKRNLNQRYQQAQSGKRKIELIDFKDIPKLENAPKRSKNQYRRL